jgi:hypothetical protein
MTTPSTTPELLPSRAAWPARLLATAVVPALLASCGGGGSDQPSGYWNGSMATERQLAALILDSGDYYLLYSQPQGGSTPAGLVRGKADFRSATITSESAVDYNWERPAAPAVATALVAQVALGSSMTGSVNGRSFSMQPGATTQAALRLANVAGSHVGTVVFTLGPRPATFEVDAQGNVRTEVNNCSVTGRIVPRTDVPAFDLTMDFSGTICAFPGARFTGVAFFDADHRNLHAAVTGTPAGFGPQAIGFVAPQGVAAGRALAARVVAN